MMKVEQKQSKNVKIVDMPEEYYVQFTKDMEDYARTKKGMKSLRTRAKPKLHDYVVNPETGIRVCVLNDSHRGERIVKTGTIASRNLKMRWWCWLCKSYFTAYEFKREADIAAAALESRN